MARFLFGLVVGLLLLPAAGWLWFTHGHPPIAVVDQPLPFERQIAGAALDARIQHELATSVPVEANEDAFVAGARVYRQQCAFCHGVNGNPSQVGKHMFPGAPPLWEKHGHGDVVGVSDDPPAETYWKVANGIRLTGMPAYKSVLSDQEMWQVSLLLANADKPLPPAALDLLTRPLNFDAAPLAGLALSPVGPRSAALPAK